jgi:restriction system protein
MWEYGEAGRILTARCVGARECIYCQSALMRIPAEAFEVGSKRLFVQMSICTECGWWTVYRVHQGEYPRTAGFAEGYSGTIGCLKELDLTDISLPLGEVRKYFLVRKATIHEVHPKVLEQVVCSIFKDLGWTARVTAYSGDDGIDVILDDDSGKTVGVQVKRYKGTHRIEAEQIRSLAGALQLGGHTKGVFITTSSFRRGAVKTAERFTGMGRPIELLDAEKFLKALGIAQRQTFEWDQDRITSYIVTTGLHLGTGVEKPFQPGEDLLSVVPVPRNGSRIIPCWLSNVWISQSGKCKGKVAACSRK